MQIKQGLYLDAPDVWEYSYGAYTVEWPATDRGGRRLSITAEHNKDGSISLVHWGQYDVNERWEDGARYFDR